MILQMMLIF